MAGGGEVGGDRGPLGACRTVDGDGLRGQRFGELRSGLGIGSPKTLTERLRILEHQKILTRTVYPEVPPRVVYELTERGHSFRSVLEAMAAWGDADLEAA